MLVLLKCQKKVLTVFDLFVESLLNKFYWRNPMSANLKCSASWIKTGAIWDLFTHFVNCFYHNHKLKILMHSMHGFKKMFNIFICVSRIGCSSRRYGLLVNYRLDSLSARSRFVFVCLSVCLFACELHQDNFISGNRIEYFYRSSFSNLDGNEGNIF